MCPEAKHLPQGNGRVAVSLPRKRSFSSHDSRTGHLRNDLDARRNGSHIRTASASAGGSPLLIEGRLAEGHAAAVAAIGRLGVAGAMVPEPAWFLYRFVRKEAVLSSQIEGKQATLCDVASFEATSGSDTRPTIGPLWCRSGCSGQRGQRRQVMRRSGGKGDLY